MARHSRFSPLCVCLTHRVLQADHAACHNTHTIDFTSLASLWGSFLRLHVPPLRPPPAGLALALRRLNLFHPQMCAYSQVVILWDFRSARDWVREGGEGGVDARALWGFIYLYLVCSPQGGRTQAPLLSLLSSS